MPVSTILALIAAFPQALSTFTAFWNDIRGTFSTEDQATIDAALTSAQTQDAADTATADAALKAAEQQ